MSLASLDLRIGSRRLPFELLLACAVIFTHAFAAAAPLNSLMYWYPTDDAFYYFQVARHITAGQGVTFDGFNPANGFHPLWMLVCLPVFSLAAVDLVLPLRILILLMAALNAATAILLYRLLRRMIHPLAAALAAVIWAFTPAIHAITTLRGMESGLGAFSAVLLLSVLDAQERRGWKNLKARDLVYLSLAAALVVFSRLDNVFFAALVGLWVVFRRGGLNGYLLAYLTAGVGIVFTAYFLRLGFSAEFPEYLPGLVVYLGITLAARLAVYLLLGMHAPPAQEPWVREAARMAAGVGVTALLGGGGMLILGRAGIVGGFPRAVILIDAGLSLAALAGIRAAARLFDRPGANAQRALGWKELSRAFPTWFRTGLAYAWPLGVLLMIYVAWNELSFGTFMPVSGQIKHWWGQVGDTIYGRPVQSFAGLFGLQDSAQGPWALLWIPFNALSAPLSGQWPRAGIALGSVVYAGLAAWLWRSLRGDLCRWLGLVFAAGLIQVLYYNGTYYVNLRPWYWISQMLWVVLFWSLLLDGLVRRMGAVEHARNFVRPAAAAAALIILGMYTLYQFRLVPLDAQARSTYPDLAETRELERLTPPGARIGMTGGGIVAYFIRDRVIVNLDGLMNSPAYFAALKAGQGRAVVDSFDLEYVFGGEYILLHSNPYYFTLADRLVQVTSLGGGYVYEYRVP